MAVVHMIHSTDDDDETVARTMIHTPSSGLACPPARSRATMRQAFA